HAAQCADFVVTHAIHLGEVPHRHYGHGSNSVLSDRSPRLRGEPSGDTVRRVPWDALNRPNAILEPAATAAAATTAEPATAAESTAATLLTEDALLLAGALGVGQRHDDVGDDQLIGLEVAAQHLGECGPVGDAGRHTHGRERPGGFVPQPDLTRLGAHFERREHLVYFLTARLNERLRLCLGHEDRSRTLRGRSRATTASGPARAPCHEALAFLGRKVCEVAATTRPSLTLWGLGDAARRCGRRLLPGCGSRGWCRRRSGCRPRGRIAGRRRRGGVDALGPGGALVASLTGAATLRRRGRCQAEGREHIGRRPGPRRRGGRAV